MWPRFRSTTILGLAVLAIVHGAVAAEDAPTPVDYAGLLAWYDARSLYDDARDRVKVQDWPDASGNGHDLTEEGGGLGSAFRTNQLGDKPVVQVGKHSSFAVADPFPLGDHTIFLVYRSSEQTLGLFSAARNDQLGVVIARDGKEHLIHAGPRDFPYNTSGVSSEYSITVLSRSGGRLRAFVDGGDVSSDIACDSDLEVGRLFQVSLSRAVTRDAQGLRIAEMIFYGRALTDTERYAISGYLADKYALELPEPAPVTAVTPPSFDWSAAKPEASLATTLDADLNTDGLVLPWDKPNRVKPPFRRDPDHPTRLYADHEGRIHVSLRLWLRTSATDTQLRILIQRNESDWLPDESVTRPDPAEPEGTRLVGRLDASVDMGAGDYLEVFVVRDGGPGTITVISDESALLAVRDPG